MSQGEIQSINWKRQLKRHMFPPENHIATEGEKGIKFLLTNNLLIRIVWTLEAFVYFGISCTSAMTQTSWLQVKITVQEEVLLFKTDMSIYSCITVQRREQMEYLQWHKLCAVKQVTKILEQEKKKSVTLSVLLHQAPPKDCSCFRITYPILRNEKATDFFGKNTLCEKKRCPPATPIWVYAQTTHTQPLHPLSQCLYCFCNKYIAFARMESCVGNKLWRGLGNQHEPASN